MEAGHLNRRVFIDSAVETQDSTTGAMDRSWSVLAEVWAEIAPLRGREQLTDGGIRAEADTRIVIRYASALAGLNATHRIRHVLNGITEIYNIVAPVQPLLAHQRLEILCKSGINAG